MIATIFVAMKPRIYECTTVLAILVVFLVAALFIWGGVALWKHNSKVKGEELAE
jgi:TRAP-type C4-dicarboxylate transport system permease small subunit